MDHCFDNAKHFFAFSVPRCGKNSKPMYNQRSLKPPAITERPTSLANRATVAPSAAAP
jgi:hypothetical protein